jgi:alginate O-acetyltransferase complex protein AlgI
MAIGLGLSLGFSFPRNFDLPYTSPSITEFWRRWHISLSQWLRDYLYIPLGGSRRSTVETWRNLCLVFLLCGLWHGANWTFVIWGAHHGCFLILERAGLMRRLERAPVFATRLYALAAVMTGWVWLRARDVDHALSFFTSLIGIHGWTEMSLSTHAVLHPVTLTAAALGAVLATTQIDILRLGRQFAAPIARPVFAIADTIVIGLFLGLAVLSVAAGSYSPFLYFRF